MGVTGYEAKAYADLGRIADSLERIANALEVQAISTTTRDGAADARERRLVKIIAVKSPR